MTLNEALADARSTFPNFPDDVFRLWLDDRIGQNGWPPSGIEWSGFLDGMTVSYWQSLQWKRTRLTISPEMLTATAFQLVMQLVEAATGKSNLMSRYIPNTAERFKSCMAYVQQHGTTPSTLLLRRSTEGISIIEGNHRVAALLAVQSRFPAGAQLLPVEAWVASEPSDA